MELKNYQQNVINDIEEYLGYIQSENDIKKAYDLYWENKIGPYNFFENTGMPPYKNNIKNAAHICIKVPTAGGKTFIAINALHSIFSAYNSNKPKVVVWLVPWSNLLTQTIENLSNPEHPYRQKLNSLFNNKVEIYNKNDLLQGSNFNPSVVQDQLSILVMSFASLRANNKEDRKVYKENGQLNTFAELFINNDHILEGVDDSALINVLRYLNPILIVDESHNAESDLSIDMLKNLNPSFILDLTATPRNNSNIISFVPAIELKKENMVKLPVIVHNSHDRSEVINNALHLQKKLELLADAEFNNGGKYIRPIVLFQAQPKTSDDNTTFEKLKMQLLNLGIPKNHIKIKTANIDELKNIDLMSSDCEVRYIITINALKEGWDCPFAYILASLADKSSQIDVEQILGRVLRQPYVQKHSSFQLNMSYVLTASLKFNETLQGIVKALQESGYSENDYRKIDNVTEEEKKEAVEKSVETFLFPDSKIDEPINFSAINFNPEKISLNCNENKAITEIEFIAAQQSKELEDKIKNQKYSPNDNAIFQDLGCKVKKYKIKAAYTEAIKEMSLPQFYIQVNGNDLFGKSEELLNRESLLKDFKLSNEDIKIDFESVSSELYKIDLEESNNNEFSPTFTKIDNPSIKDHITEYILSRPKESQIAETTSQIMNIIGNMYPIPDQEIKKYISRVLSDFDTDKLRDIIMRRCSYTDKIKYKIKTLADSYAEIKFNDYIKSKKIIVKNSWLFKSEIIPGNISSSIGNSLYEKEGIMNNLEERIAMEIGTSENIDFWHRNLERGKGFYINGFKSNHYPDFIMKTKTGKIILIETKGDHLDNTDSSAKCRLGSMWESLAGKDYAYFMIYEKKEITGAYPLEKAKELICSM